MPGCCSWGSISSTPAVPSHRCSQACVVSRGVCEALALPWSRGGSGAEGNGLCPPAQPGGGAALLELPPAQPSLLTQYWSAGAGQSRHPGAPGAMRGPLLWAGCLLGGTTPAGPPPPAGLPATATRTARGRETAATTTWPCAAVPVSGGGMALAGPPLGTPPVLLCSVASDCCYLLAPYFE